MCGGKGASPAGTVGFAFTAAVVGEFILLIFSGLNVVEHRLTPWRAPAT